MTHRIAGPLATHFLDRFYLLWFFIMVGTQAWLNFAKDPVFQIRGLLSFLGLWVGAGLIAATMFSSVGPCFYAAFYGDDRYAPLMDILAQNDPPLVAPKAMTWLLETETAGRLGGGISAMPSLHVGMACLLAILLHHRFSNRWPAWLGFSYVSLIWFSSVHLGWHYATDGALSILLAILIWKATGLLFNKEPARPESQKVLAGETASI